MSRVEGPVTHVLTLHPEPFSAVMSGERTFDIRPNNHRYAVADEVELREVALDGAATGRCLRATISYLTYTTGRVQVILALRLSP